MNDFKRLLIIVGVIAYCISPIDALPGPIDDFIVVLLGAASTFSNKRMTSRR